MIRSLIKIFFTYSLTVWIILAIWELSDPGSIQRWLNLELYFYGLLAISLYLRLTSQAKLK